MIKESPVKIRIHRNDYLKQSNLRKYLGEIIHIRGTTGLAHTSKGWVSGRLEDVGERKIYLGGGGSYVGSMPLSEVSEIKVEALKTTHLLFDKPELDT